MSSSQRQIKLNQRHKILLDIISHYSRQIDPPTAALLHEYILLCQLQEQDRRMLQDYKFHAYMSGPYSEQLRQDIATLLGLSLISIKNSKLGLTKYGLDFLKQLSQEKAIRRFHDIFKEVRLKYKTPADISSAINGSLSSTDLGQSVST